ncbi:CPBP family intramembrane glutamic endopeptidase [Winogradskyella aquimaris]|uniref:CPBP family intramembrane glutamic endopeptidase n=1 Tax=Winogradskyella aquimaris TaxID=864074 RepID=A0ABU5EL96_9FLAO|nr:CPBP family intramembrane glutamic endopeptidase [Winogradskyella aquimaris]MDY2586822.1 CPBP family intramembrane glutamic endopeptidase [Winogradskyella aquimaris]
MTINKTVLSIIAIGTIILLPHAELIPFFGYSIPILLFIRFVLKYTNESFSDIGFSFKPFKPNTILFGGLIAILTLAFMQLIFHPVLDYFVSLDYNDSGLNDTIQSEKLQFFIMVIMGWLIGGFYEEIVFHGFIFTRLEKIIKGKYSTSISAFATIIIFGFYHIQLGALGLINALVVGAVYLALFLYYKRNLWYSIFCHGFYNTMVMTLIYYDYL